MRVTGRFEKMENERIHFLKCKSIVDSSDEEDEVAQGSTFTEKANKRSIVPTDEWFSSREQDLSMPESDSGGDEPLLSKRAKTTHQTDILKRLKKSSSSFLSSGDSFISDNAAASSFSTPFQSVSKKLVKFSSAPNFVAKSNLKLLSTGNDIDLNTENVSSVSLTSTSNQNIVLSPKSAKQKQVDKEVGRLFEDNAGNSGILFSYYIYEFS